MALKAAKRSPIVVPLDVIVSPSAKFTVNVKHITPRQGNDINAAATTHALNPKSGVVEPKFDAAKYVELLFDAVVGEVSGLTLDTVDQMVVIEEGRDEIPVNEDGTITDRATVKFLWMEAPAPVFSRQVTDFHEHILYAAKLRREVGEGNSVVSSAA